MKIHLPAATSFRLYHPEQSGFFHLGDVFIWQTAKRIRLGGTGTQFGRKRTGRGDQGRGIGRGCKAGCVFIVRY
jgi:hypothetical protein